ncbi:DUF1697 domain-containing protein [Phytohabitans aurantiacus]|jgi:uncharacterized protein (DUF1697 family)|uniref:DUF1697 domain-containing protein n=1 Tax=Phytohabitans aurantiacus TaxID=3016789 RepID=A0ABQ5QTH0_9ACTN|nr:DUF1697 domain-containing protein [Phytohabitans aurantiacus]GLH96615.1 hypothetical protein Pa4123_18890 [Phytohabitans aurantiacus]
MREWVCLLRAINLGARNKVGMPQLRKALDAAGFENVRTYVQSGNVVLESEHRAAGKVAAAVRSVVKEEFGLDTPVLVRTPRDIREIVAWCPFPEEAAARPTAVQVVHFDTKPAAARVAATLAEDWSPDRLEVRAWEACILYSATMHASRLQHAALLKRLGVGGTARNWRTMLAIADLLSD